MKRVAVVGLGYWGPNLARNFHLHAGSRLAAVCDLVPARLEAAARAYPAARATASFESVLADPEVDAVSIATPVETHFRLAKAALEGGKHVLVEKPFTSTSEQAEELIDLARRQGLVLMVDHVFVYHPAVRRMKEILDEDGLGDLYFINSVRVNLGQFQHDVNVVWDLAPHDLSIIDYLVGRLPKSLSAFGSAHKHRRFEDVAYINLDFGGGLIAGFHVSWLSPVKVRSIMIGGSKQCLIFNDLDPVEKVKLYESSVTVREGDLEGTRRLLVEYRTGDVRSPHVPNVEALQRVVGHFVECIEEGKQPLTDGAAGLRIVQILEAAQQSIKAQGGRITL